MPSKVYIPSQVRIQGGFDKDIANFIVHGGLPNSRKNSLRHSLSFSWNMLLAGGVFCAVNPIVGGAIIAYAGFDAGFKTIFYENSRFRANSKAILSNSNKVRKYATYAGVGLGVLGLGFLTAGAPIPAGLVAAAITCNLFSVGANQLSKTARAVNREDVDRQMLRVKARMAHRMQKKFQAHLREINDLCSSNSSILYLSKSYLQSKINEDQFKVKLQKLKSNGARVIEDDKIQQNITKLNEIKSDSNKLNNFLLNLQNIHREFGSMSKSSTIVNNSAAGVNVLFAAFAASSTTLPHYEELVIKELVDNIPPAAAALEFSGALFAATPAIGSVLSASAAYFRTSLDDELGRNSIEELSMVQQQEIEFCRELNPKKFNLFQGIMQKSCSDLGFKYNKKDYVITETLVAVFDKYSKSFLENNQNAVKDIIKKQLHKVCDFNKSINCNTYHHSVRSIRVEKESSLVTNKANDYHTNKLHQFDATSRFTQNICANIDVNFKTKELSQNCDKVLEYLSAKIDLDSSSTKSRDFYNTFKYEIIPDIVLSIKDSSTEFFSDSNIFDISTSIFNALMLENLTKEKGDKVVVNKKVVSQIIKRDAQNFGGNTGSVDHHPIPGTGLPVIVAGVVSNYLNLKGFDIESSEAGDSQCLGGSRNDIGKDLLNPVPFIERPEFSPLLPPQQRDQHNAAAA